MNKRKDEGWEERHMKKRKGLEIRPIPVPQRADHEPPPYGLGLLPIHEFTLGLIAPKGKGKTTTIMNMLEMYRDYFHEIHIFSPSIKSDVKWRYIKQLPLLAENHRLRNIVRHHDEQRFGVVHEAPLSKKLAGLVDFSKKFDPKIPKENFHDRYEQKLFEEIMERNRAVVDILDENGYMKTDANRLLVIFDDPVGMNVYSNRRNDYFTGTNTRHRHYSLSMFEVTQGYKEMPKTVRTNFTSLLVYKIGNMKELEVIYEEFQMDLTWEEWLELYREATKEPHDFLFLDMYGPENMKMRKNLDKALLFLSDSDSDTEPEEPKKKKSKLTK